MGRKPKPIDAVKRSAIGLRTTKAIYDRLAAEAESSGRSVVQEVERRLDQSFQDDALQRRAFGSRQTEIAAYLWGSTVRLLELTSGRSWTSDAGVRAAAAGAMAKILEELAT